MAKYILCLVAALSLASTINAIYWTSWLDRDNPSGTGDWEHVGSNGHKNLCKDGPPVDIQCRQKSTKTPYYFTGDIFKIPCVPEKGLVCRNQDNLGSCKDYEVRFGCCNKWSAWLDRDNPSGTGDWEHTSGFKPSPCGNLKPRAIQCRRKGTNIMWYSTGESFYSPCTVDFGLVCINKQQKDKTCYDYEVRYCCEYN